MSKFDNVFLAPSAPGIPINVFDARIYTSINVPAAAPPTSVRCEISRLTIAMADTGTKMGLATKSQKDMVGTLNVNTKSTFKEYCIIWQ
jgi:hypothetical protein